MRGFLLKQLRFVCPAVTQVFSKNFAFWWSPQSEIIAYLRSDETAVKDYTLQYYNPTGAAFDPSPYPENFVMK